MKTKEIDYLAEDRDEPWMPRKLTSSTPAPKPARRPGRRARKTDTYNPDKYRWETP